MKSIDEIFFCLHAGMRIRILFLGSGSAEEKKIGSGSDSESDLNSNETKIFIYFNEKKNIYIIIRSFGFIQYSGLCFVKDENNFIYPFLQVGSSSLSACPICLYRSIA